MYGQRFKIKFDKEAFKKFFENDKNVICALVFGSSKNGIINKDSDLDIAVLFHNPPKGRGKLNYYYKICDIDSNIERIDFVVLNTANEILAFEALKGEYLCKNDVEENAAFFSLTCRKYESQMASYERQQKYRIEHRTKF